MTDPNSLDTGAQRTNEHDATLRAEALKYRWDISKAYGLRPRPMTGVEALRVAALTVLVMAAAFVASSLAPRGSAALIAAIAGFVVALLAIRVVADRLGVELVPTRAEFDRRHELVQEYDRGRRAPRGRGDRR